MLEEGRHFAKIAPNIVRQGRDERERPRGDQPVRRRGHQDQLHADLHANQGLLAAKAGATLISPFVGRLDDINQDGMIVIRELAEIFAIHEIDPRSWRRRSGTRST